MNSASPRQNLVKKIPMVHIIDKNPEALIDIMDAEADGHPSMRSAANDFRPNRAMKHTTRTSRVVRKSGVYNSFHHRNRVEADLQKKRENPTTKQQSAHAQKLAAERIQ